jgi:uncharacterized membrane protein YsdA (DUF1294 family)
MHVSWLIFLGYCVAVNAIAFGMFAWDKFRAQESGWRISEASLLFVALIGGSIGAVFAQYRLRHKTRKEPFRSILFGICVLQAFLVPLFIYPASRNAILLNLM